MIHAFIRITLHVAFALPLAAGLLHLCVQESGAQENGQDVAPMLQFWLPDDPYDQPLLRRSLISDDKELRALESQVDDYEQRQERERQRRNIFFEDIENLDNSPFLK